MIDPSKLHGRRVNANRYTLNILTQFPERRSSIYPIAFAIKFRFDQRGI